MKKFKNLLSLLKIAGQIDGRIKLQKITYILKNNGVNFEEDFKYHHYGPYSGDLQLKLEELIDNNVITENGSNPYLYKLSDDYSMQIDESDLKDKKELILFLTKQHFRDLELVATIYYLLNQGYTGKALENKLKILKPNLVNRINNAFNILKKIEKISKN